ncbi:hypothetical protein CHS0354_028413 [Potamilus streckersoni]|uniref:G-protein coupled receptors family 1 profile domain-containing protein n=1 Tax=Potamilus streckersoni TaxID=2493646 RepID=A0AAE0SQA9_9BIVA|nr:hypothetical protein CHS0354_028413 [Potamilus streckersoni]
MDWSANNTTSDDSGTDMGLDIDTASRNESLLDLMNDKLKLTIFMQVNESKPFDFTTEIIFIVAFALLIAFGALGNGLVCFVVIKNPHMRTPRNIFIINLAISDLTLCLFTQPLNLYKLLNTQWFLGSFMCKFSAMIQGTNVFVSTISITAIALDRFQVIVYPTKDSMKKIGGCVALVTIWIISFLMSSPLLIFSVYKRFKPLSEFDIYHYLCIEDLSLIAEKGAYSVVSMVVQYIMPIVIVSIAHARICNKLKYRMGNRSLPPSDAAPYHRQATNNRARRKQRTNCLLAIIGVVFGLSWLPLNLFNILTEFQFYMFRSEYVDIRLAYVICHLFVLSSACTNPVLYGWLNENFRTEFLKILRCTCFSDLKINVRFCNDRSQARTNTIPVITFTRDETVITHFINGIDNRRGTATSAFALATDIDNANSIVSL